MASMDYAMMDTFIGLGVTLLISEILPFVKDSKAKGVLQGILMLLASFSKAVPPPPAAQATAGCTTS